MNLLHTIVIILTLLAAILLIGIVLIQKSKGGGLSSSFAGSNQNMGDHMVSRRGGRSSGNPERVHGSLHDPLHTHPDGNLHARRPRLQRSRSIAGSSRS